MNTTHFKSTLMTAFAVTIALAITGCASSGGKGYKQADKTGQGMAEFRDEVIKAQTAINDTMKSLDQVAATADTNPRKAFDQYAKQVNALESAANRLSKRAQDMQAAGDAYFKQWETEMAQVQNPDIRKLAEERKAALQSAFANIRTYTTPLKEQFTPWMSDLKDLRSYLNNDLTIAGVDAVKKQFVKAQKEGAGVQEAMDALVAELNSVAAALTPAKVEPQKK
jgi:hypothetical protein